MKLRLLTLFGKVRILLTHRSSTTTSLRKSEATLDRPSSHAYTTAAEGRPSSDAHESSSDLATSRCQRCSTATAPAINMRLHAAATPQIPGLDARRRQAGAAAGSRPLRRQEHDLPRERLQRDRLTRSWRRRDPEWQHCRVCMWHTIQTAWATEHLPHGCCCGSKKTK